MARGASEAGSLATGALEAATVPAVADPLEILKQQMESLREQSTCSITLVRTRCGCGYMLTPKLSTKY